MLATVMPVAMIDQQPGREERAEDRAAPAEDVGAAEHDHQHHVQFAAGGHVVAHRCRAARPSSARQWRWSAPKATKRPILIRRTRMPAWRAADLAGADLVDLPAIDGDAEQKPPSATATTTKTITGTGTMPTMR